MADADPAIPYIGSRISLISKSDIRYEGILYTINMEESSIALKDVVSHGTEGRRLAGPQVPPSSEVYEYIIFKGDDIKDLTVLGPAAAPAAAPVINDPAVLSVGSYGAPPAPPAPAYGNAWGAPAPPPSSQGYTALYGSSQWGPPSAQPAYPPAAPPPPAAPAPPPPQPPQQQQAKQVAPQVQISPAPPAPRPPAEKPSAPPPKPANYAQAAGAPRMAPGGGRGPAPGRGGPPPAPGGGRAPSYVPAGGRGRGAPPPPAPAGPRPAAPPAPAPLPVPTEDFNFEEQNAKFKKEELVKEVKVEKLYNKDSFFDDISCETLERLQLAEARDSRQRAADARRLDMETFGGLGGLRHNYGGRGRGGRGGRGGDGGRGGPGGGGRGYGGGRGMRPQSTGMPSGGRGGRH